MCVVNVRAINLNVVVGAGSGTALVIITFVIIANIIISIRVAGYV